jgi:uncharacterized protein YmfQ (DUF2313 family)
MPYATNPYVAPKLARFLYNTHAPISGPLPTQPETNTHFIARYKRPVYRFLRSNNEFTIAADKTAFIPRTPIPQYDRHVRRDSEAYVEALIGLLPQGSAWPRDPEAVLMKTVTGLAGIWGNVDGRAADLLERESDPRMTLELLPDWERAFGLPDKCLAEPVGIAERQVALVARITFLGAQSREFFIALAKLIGYDITIREYAPWMFGISECGETSDDTGYWRWEIGAPEMRFAWTIFVNTTRIVWWRYGSAEIGIDPHLRIGLATDLECIIRRYKPAHTEVFFDYSRLSDRPGMLDFSDPDRSQYIPGLL